jgi:hypothetical protein
VVGLDEAWRGARFASLRGSLILDVNLIGIHKLIAKISQFRTLKIGVIWARDSLVCDSC